jgi:hypothetical protein
MAYDYLGLVNEVNRRLNEVELTSGTFSSAKGFHAIVKDAVNASLRDVYHSHYEWPFNHVLGEESLSAGTTRYAFPLDANTIDFDTFRIIESAALGTETRRLGVLTYDEYLQSYITQEHTSDTSYRGIPAKVFHATGNEFGVVPAPDKNYEIVYEYYRIPVDLEKYDDVPAVPERFRHTVVDGAMYHAYMFRSNEQAASISKGKFEEGIKRMRTMLMNRYEYVKSTFKPSTGSSSAYIRVA